MLATDSPVHALPQTLGTNFPTGREVLATRAQIEAETGWWSDTPILCDDGRATRLFDLPDGTTLMLARTGALLVVQPTARSGVYRAFLISGSAPSIWEALAERVPGVWPGRGGLRRYWVLQERLGGFATLFAVFDLLTGAAVGRTPDESDAARLALQLEGNGPGCPT